MTEQATPTMTVEITAQQREIILGALYTELINREGNVLSYQVDDEPGPLDTCCDAHRAKYVERKNLYTTLIEHKEALEATIELFSHEED